MILGNKMNKLFIILIYFFFIPYSFGEDKITSTPLLNLEKIKPSFEETEEKDEQSSSNQNIKHKKKIVSRQMAPKTFDHVAAMYIFKTDYIKKTNYFLNGLLKIYELPLIKSIDIDTHDDYSLVKKIMKK